MDDVSIFEIKVIERYDNPNSPEPTSHLLLARVRIGDRTHDTRWSALLDADHKYTCAGLEDSDQWVDAKLSERAHTLGLDHARLVEIGEAVIAEANARGALP
jgi:hypothetical protein